MWYDILTLVILLVSTIRGAVTGLVWQLAVIAALVLCFLFAGPLSFWVAPHIPVDAPLNRWLAMLGIYLVFSFVCFLVARTARDWIKKARFVEYDRHVGAILGFLKGATICLLLTFFAVTLSGDLRATILQSHSGRAAALMIDALCPVVPREWHDVLEPYLRRMGHSDEARSGTSDDGRFNRFEPSPDTPIWPDSGRESSGDSGGRRFPRDSEPLENPGFSIPGI